MAPVAVPDKNRAALQAVARAALRRLLSAQLAQVGRTTFNAVGVSAESGQAWALTYSTRWRYTVFGCTVLDLRGRRPCPLLPEELAVVRACLTGDTDVIKLEKGWYHED